MRLYDNGPDSNYEALKTLYPVWYRDVLEMDALWRAFGPQLDDMQKELGQAVDNGFIWSASEPVIAELEKFLYIPVDRAKPLTERKSLVASFSIGNGHIGEREIKAVIGIFTNGVIEVALVGGTIEVSVTRELSDRFNLADGLYILLKKIPAHLRLTFRDILLPILFENRNALIFRKFGVQSSFSNRGQTEPILLTGRHALDGLWKLDQIFSGITFQLFRAIAVFTSQNQIRAPVQLFRSAFALVDRPPKNRVVRFGTQFFNNSETERIMLDARRALDGSWLLNQELRGIIFPLFGIALRTTNHELSRASCIAFSYEPLVNTYQSNMESFGTTQGSRNTYEVKPHTLGLALGGVQQAYSLRGALTKNSMYRLGGAVQLNGSRKLNAQIIKEDL